MLHRDNREIVNTVDRLPTPMAHIPTRATSTCGRALRGHKQSCT